MNIHDRRLGQMTLPTFVGVGGMKCATTWLAECLREHPRVFVSTQKEVEFFSRCWERGLGWYANHFRDAGNAAAVGEFSVSYLTHPEAPKRIFDTLGRILIIVSLRDPAERFLSHYKHYIRNRKLPLPEFETLSVATLRRAIDFQPELFENGRYASGLERYLTRFGREAIHVIFKERIDSAPQEAIRQLFRFVGVDSDYRPRLLARRVSKGIVPRVAELERLRIATYRFAERRWPELIVMSRKLRVGEAYRRFNNRKETPRVEPEARRELSRLYRGEIREVEALLGEPLSWGHE